MPHPVIRLANGLRLIHKESRSPVSNFGIIVNAGTRDEKAADMGLAHFVEHTIFKGTQKRNAYRVLSRMEDVGGDLNACTSKEETCFHATFLSPDYPRAVELLSDIFFHATFPEKELEKEKTVILEEINYYKDTPSEMIFDEFEDLLFAGHPLGKNILGTKTTVRKMTRAAVFDFIRRNYTLDNVVLASVGDIPAKRLVGLCNRYFGGTALPQSVRERTPFTGYVAQTRRVTRKSNQANCMLGGLAYPLTDERRLPFLLLINLLGGQGMKTRLNMAIREKRGLAYAVEANYTPLSDTGFFTVYFGCDNHRVDACIDLIYKELDKIKGERLGSMQLACAKKQFVGQLALANEVKLNEMLALGHAAQYFDEVDTFEESVGEVSGVTADELMDVANEVFDYGRFSMLIESGAR